MVWWHLAGQSNSTNNCHRIRATRRLQLWTVPAAETGYRAIDGVKRFCCLGHSSEPIVSHLNNITETNNFSFSLAIPQTLLLLVNLNCFVSKTDWTNLQCTAETTSVTPLKSVSAYMQSLSVNLTVLRVMVTLYYCPLLDRKNSYLYLFSRCFSPRQHPNEDQRTGPGHIAIATGVKSLDQGSNSDIILPATGSEPVTFWSRMLTRNPKFSLNLMKWWFND